jgi:hypothetical protein
MALPPTTNHRERLVAPILQVSNCVFKERKNNIQPTPKTPIIVYNDPRDVT